MLLIAIYNSFVVPFTFAFFSKYDQAKASIEDYVIDSIFIIDIILMFMTSTLTKYGKETYDTLYIRSAYIGTFRFKVDIVSVFGIRKLQQFHWIFTLCALAKMFRVFRLH